MNALANSQVGELEKFLQFGYGEGREPVTFARYTGQEQGGEREEILRNPPDILLTNYVMLELMLTRPEERRKLVDAAQGLQFLVLDELHTYRGRQGADVAMLVRRVRDACQSPDLQCVGTSATMASAGTADGAAPSSGRGRVRVCSAPRSRPSGSSARPSTEPPSAIRTTSTVWIATSGRVEPPATTTILRGRRLRPGSRSTSAWPLNPSPGRSSGRVRSKVRDTAARLAELDRHDGR